MPLGCRAVNELRDPAAGRVDRLGERQHPARGFIAHGLPDQYRSTGLEAEVNALVLGNASRADAFMHAGDGRAEHGM